MPTGDRTYTPELAAEICERLAAGESLRGICKSEHMPPESTVRSWVIDDVHGFAAQYARARDLGLDALAEEVIEIADESPGTLDNGATDSGGVAHKRLRFDARRWYLSKLAPKKYGDKLEIEGKVDIGMAERLARARKRTTTPDDDGSDLAG